MKPDPLLLYLRTIVLALAFLGFPITLISVDRLWDHHPVLADGRSLPFGFDVITAHFVPDQDFSYNLIFFREIWERRVAHPYRFADQEIMVREGLPNVPYGLAHAYSPVALVLALPFLALPARPAYLLYITLSYLGLLALLKYYLLPRAQNSFQVLCLVPCLLGYSLATSFAMGQTSLFTTGFLALLWIQMNKSALPQGNWRSDLALAVLAWAICAKPSIGMVALALLAGMRCWRALFYCGGLLGLTWIWLAPHYGGLVSGLQDYAWLLGHYCRAEMTPFLRDSFTILSNTSLQAFLVCLHPALEETPFAFDLARALNLFGFVLLLLLVWRRWIGSAVFFYGLLWNFLLFCPYLLATEDWVLCLFIVRNPFFRFGPGMIFQLLLIFGIINGRIGLLTMWPIFFPLKLTLCFWWMLDRYRTHSPAESSPISLHEPAP